MKLIRIFFVAILFSAFSFPTPGNWEKLFNGRDLDGWDTWLGPGFDADGRQIPGTAPGLNKDPRKVFSIVDLEGEKVIRVSGENFGALTSRREFGNYHLQLKFKWGNKKWPPKLNAKMDSGLLYHCVGPHAGDSAFWKRSQEFQIEEGNTGDYWGVAGAFENISAKRTADDRYRYDAESPSTVFGEHTPAGRNCVKQGDAEKPSGEWNVVDLYCLRGTSLHVVNGKLVMMLTMSQQWDRGMARPLENGRLQLQSEGAEIYYKDIKLMPIDKLPQELMR